MNVDGPADAMIGYWLQDMTKDWRLLEWSLAGAPGVRSGPLNAIPTACSEGMCQISTGMDAYLWFVNHPLFQRGDRYESKLTEECLAG